MFRETAFLKKNRTDEYGTIPIKLVCVGLPAAGQAVSDHEKCSLLQAMQTDGVQVSVSCICTKCTVLWIRIAFNTDPD